MACKYNNNNIIRNNYRVNIFYALRNYRRDFNARDRVTPRWLGKRPFPSKNVIWRIGFASYYFTHTHTCADSVLENWVHKFRRHAWLLTPKYFVSRAKIRKSNVVTTWRPSIDFNCARITLSKLVPSVRAIDAQRKHARKSRPRMGPTTTSLWP